VVEIHSRLLPYKPTNSRVCYSYTESYAHADAHTGAQHVEQRDSNAHADAYGTGMPGRSGLSHRSLSSRFQPSTVPVRTERDGLLGVRRIATRTKPVYVVHSCAQHVDVAHSDAHAN
jgi:hypothetical protein